MTHLWDGANIVADEGAYAAKYLRGIGLIMSVDGINGGRYYLYNAHGDVVQLTNAVDGAVAKEYDYDAFGNQREIEGQNADTDTNPFRYCGEYLDFETNTYYLRARYYSPTTGRFLSEDSMKDGLNWYTYCGGNPILFIDPSGMWKITPNGTILMEDFDNPNDEYLLKAKITWANASSDAERDLIARQAAAYREIIGDYTITADMSLSSFMGFYNGQGLGYTTMMQLGGYSMSDKGCGVVATFNALLALNDPIKMSDIAAYYENVGAGMLFGSFVWGTRSDAVGSFFKDRGYTVTTGEYNDFEDIIKSNTITIMMFWNNKNDMTEGMHYVAMRYVGGSLETYNLYNNRDKVYTFDNVDQFLGGKREVQAIFGIS